MQGYEKFFNLALFCFLINLAELIKRVVPAIGFLANLRTARTASLIQGWMWMLPPHQSLALYSAGYPRRTVGWDFEPGLIEWSIDRNLKICFWVLFASVW